MKPLNLFYKEPDPDRWFPYDRYIRRVIRRIVRGKERPGGVMMVALELMKGLDKIGYPYRFNDFKYIHQNPLELACIIGKPFLLFSLKWENPILFGAGVYSHPIDCPDLFVKYPNVLKMLVPGPWMKNMCVPYYGNKVQAWPVGIDTEKWNDGIKQPDASIDFLIYHKVRWDVEKYDAELINPILKILVKRGLSFHIIKYGFYNHQELLQLLGKSKGVIFLCEHETQGIAYQQILATNTPILAWDRGGFWKDPEYFPRVKYEGDVSSVPYWDERCGVKFKGLEDFENSLEEFRTRLLRKSFKPREFILQNLTLEICAEEYVKIAESLSA